jgi:hypothetical protein
MMPEMLTVTSVKRGGSRSVFFVFRFVRCSARRLDARTLFADEEQWALFFCYFSQFRFGRMSPPTTHITPTGLAIIQHLKSRSRHSSRLPFCGSFPFYNTTTNPHRHYCTVVVSKQVNIDSKQQ